MDGQGYATQALALTCAASCGRLAGGVMAESPAARSAPAAQPRADLPTRKKMVRSGPAQKQAVRRELLRIVEKNQASEIARLPAIVTLSTFPAPSTSSIPCCSMRCVR